MGAEVVLVGRVEFRGEKARERVERLSVVVREFGSQIG